MTFQLVTLCCVHSKLSKRKKTMYCIAMTFQMVTLLGNGPQAQEEAHTWDGPPTCATTSSNFVALEPQCKNLKTKAGSKICKQRTIVLET